MEFAADARGNRIARHSVDEDLDAVIETWAYDTADRLVAHRRPHDPGAGPGPAATYSYDPDHGWLTTIVDATGRVETRGYDHDGALRSETHSGGGLDTITVGRFRDARGRVSARRDTVGTEASTVTAWAYPRDGQQAAVVHPGARIIGYGWHLDGTLAAVVDRRWAPR